VAEENDIEQVWISGLLQEQPEAGMHRGINSLKYRNPKANAQWHKSH
jgi:hypothetical protein